MVEIGREVEHKDGKAAARCAHGEKLGDLGRGGEVATRDDTEAVLHRLLQVLAIAPAQFCIACVVRRLGPKVDRLILLALPP